MVDMHDRRRTVRCSGPMKNMPNERGSQTWVQLLLAFSAIVQGVCHFIGYLKPDWAQRSVLVVTSTASLVLTFVLGVVLSFMQRRPFWETVKSALKL